MGTSATSKAANTMEPLTMQELEASKTCEKIPKLHNKQEKDAPNTENPTQPGLKALSSILSLPIELHQIILNLSRSIDPGLLDLREVNKYFRSIISLTDAYTWGTTLLENKQFKAAERLYAFLRLEDRLPCTFCQCLLAKERFHMQARQGKKALGHKLGHKRFCMDCGSLEAATALKWMTKLITTRLSARNAWSS